MTDIFQQGVYSCVRIASVVGNHLCTLIVFHGFADRLLSHIRAPYFDFQNGGRGADVLIMFASSGSIINLGQLLFKALLMKFRHDEATLHASKTAAARRCAASLARPQTQKRPHYGAGLRLRWVAYSEV
ncbi:hypothetical protein ACOJBM_05500 [Rhizobium beringeri]